jgi:hypothetical protein
MSVAGEGRLRHAGGVGWAFGGSHAPLNATRPLRAVKVRPFREALTWMPSRLSCAQSGEVGTRDDQGECN